MPIDQNQPLAYMQASFDRLQANIDQSFQRHEKALDKKIDRVLEDMRKNAPPKPVTPLQKKRFTFKDTCSDLANRIKIFFKKMFSLEFWRSYFKSDTLKI